MARASQIPFQGGLFAGMDQGQAATDNMLNNLLKRALQQTQMGKAIGDYNLAQQFQPTKIAQAQANSAFKNAATAAMPIRNEHLIEMIKTSQLHRDPEKINALLSRVSQDPNDPVARGIYQMITGTDLARAPGVEVEKTQQEDINKANVQSAEKIRDSSSNIPVTWNKVNEIISLIKNNRDLTGFLKGGKYIGSVSNDAALARINQLISDIQADKGKLISGSGHTTNLALDVAKLSKLDPNATPAWNYARALGIRKDLADLYDINRKQHQKLTKQDLPIEMPDSYHAYVKAKADPNRTVTYYPPGSDKGIDLPYSEAVKRKAREEGGNQ